MLAPLLVWLSSSSGCIEYTERVTCSMDRALNEDDECVAPPLPDGGVVIATCSDLCTALGGWTADQRACITASLGVLGAPPPECSADLSVRTSCDACVAAGAFSDSLCATGGSVCQ